MMASWAQFMSKPSTSLIDSYFERIAYGGPTRVSEDTLVAIHAAQIASIPFENIDIHLDRAIHLDASSIVTKLVMSRRGGYCYELNGLLRIVLEELGFRTHMLGGRTRLNLPAVVAKTHMILVASTQSGDWIVDAGFGAYGVSAPVALGVDTVQDTATDRYRIVPVDAWHFALQWESGSDDWMTLYEFTTEPLPLVDFEVMNYYNSTSPDSRFRRSVVVARVNGGCRTLLNGRTFRRSDRSGTTERTLVTMDAYAQTLTSEFGIDVGDSIGKLFAKTSLASTPSFQ